MKKTLSLFVLSLLVVSVLPSVLADANGEVGIGVGVDIEPTDSEPLVWACGGSAMFDDANYFGRISGDGTPLVERINNYAFEGEQIAQFVLVQDYNGREDIEHVYGTIGSSAGSGNDMEVTCQEIPPFGPTIPAFCNARDLGEDLTGTPFNPNTQQYYSCVFTVETADSMYGEYWITVEAEDMNGNLGVMDEHQYWFLNPIIALSIDGDIAFEDVRPGTSSYSDPLLIGNDADDGSGVILDTFISGTDFYDSASSGAMCPTTNQLLLGDGDSFCDVGPGFSAAANSATTDPFCYKVTNANLPLADGRQDAEGYVGINYGTGFNNPNPFYGVGNGDVTGYEVVQGPFVGGYFPYNTLTPGAEHSIVFRLNLPEPCNGDFDSGSLFFWGEAI